MYDCGPVTAVSESARSVEPESEVKRTRGVPVPDNIVTETFSVPETFDIVGTTKAGGSTAGTPTAPYEKNAAFVTVA